MERSVRTPSAMASQSAQADSRRSKSRTLQNAPGPGVRQLLRGASIRVKLVCALISGCVLTLVLTTAAFVVNDVWMIEENLLAHATTLADTLGDNCATAIIFDDASVARDVLSSLKLDPSVLQAEVTTGSGQRFAAYERAGETDRSGVPSDRSAGDAIRVRRPIRHNDEVVGAIELAVSRSVLREQLHRSLVISLIVFVVAGGLAVSLALWVGHTIGRPVTDLADITRRIASTGDYSTRVPVSSTDETGQLCASFNTMLEQIQSRDDRLHAAMEEIEEARRLADEANAAKSEFLANMSHEIRTPMTAILGFTDLLRRNVGVDEDERQQHLQVIHNSGRHLLSLINDILDLSKIESGKMELERTACAPHNIVADVVSVLRVRAIEKGLTLQEEWNGNIPQTITCDPVRLRQLLMNLVGNAVKFTEQGGVRIVTRLVETGSRPQLQFEVIDTGVGIDADKLDVIFDPFSQADNSVTRRFGGTGLGLSISRKIARMHGGDITVTSRSGGGSRFTVRIDAGDLEGVRLLSESGLFQETPDSPRETGDAEETDLAGARVLLVEDGEENRKLISLVLRRAGAQITCAENGQVGADLAVRQPFDVILMDIQMPVLDGYRATALIRQQGITVPVIALTAHAMQGDKQECLAAGCSGYLSKPIDFDDLVRTIAETLSEAAPKQDSTAPLQSAAAPT